MMNKLSLNKKIYSESAVKEAISAYSNLAIILMVDRGNYWECRFKKCRFSPSITMKEFENYLIGLSVQEGAGHVSM